MKKNNVKTIISMVLIILSVVAIIGSLIWSLTFNIMNPDMTELILFIENPYPAIIVIIPLIEFTIGKALTGGLND